MDNRQKVSTAACESYEKDEVRKALLKALEPIGGLDFVKPGMRIGIKLNLCAARSPESAAVTHPVMAAELTRLLKERGAEVVLGDSPGGPFNEIYMNHIYQATGMALCEEAGGRLNRDYSYADVSFDDGFILKNFKFVNWLKNCDAVINFSKLKSHGLMGMTAAVKNLYGIIPGTFKTEYHFIYPEPADFANLLVDLNEYLRPELCICDGVTIMEGNGPTQGTARHLGIVVASHNPYALDRFCAAVTGMKEDEIPYLVTAGQRGLLPDIDDECIEDMAVCKLSDFKRSGATSSWFLMSDDDPFIKKNAKKALSVLMRSRPKLKEGCAGCGHCADMCPAKAITVKNRKAVIDRKKCVRCFCCQEFCPTGAMQAERSAIARLLQK